MAGQLNPSRSPGPTPRMPSLEEINQLLTRLEELLSKTQSDKLVQRRQAEKELLDNLATAEQFLKPVLNAKLGVDFVNNIVGGDYAVFNRLFAIVDEARENEEVKSDPRFNDILKMAYEVEKVFEKRGVDIKSNRNKRQTLKRRSRSHTMEVVQKAAAVSRSPAKFSELIASMENVLRKKVKQESESAEFQLIQLMDQYIDLTVDMLDSLEDDNPDIGKFCEMFGGNPARICLARDVFETASKVIEDSYFNYTDQCLDSCEQIEEKLEEFGMKIEKVPVGRLGDIVQHFESTKSDANKAKLSQKSTIVQQPGCNWKGGFDKILVAVCPDNVFFPSELDMFDDWTRTAQYSDTQKNVDKMFELEALGGILLPISQHSICYVESLFCHQNILSVDWRKQPGVYCNGALILGPQGREIAQFTLGHLLLKEGANKASDAVTVLLDCLDQGHLTLKDIGLLVVMADYLGGYDAAFDHVEEFAKLQNMSVTKMSRAEILSAKSDVLELKLILPNSGASEAVAKGEQDAKAKYDQLLQSLHSQGLTTCCYKNETATDFGSAAQFEYLQAPWPHMKISIAGVDGISAVSRFLLHKEVLQFLQKDYIDSSQQLATFGAASSDAVFFERVGNGQAALRVVMAWADDKNLHKSANFKGEVAAILTNICDAKKMAKKLATPDLNGGSDVGSFPVSSTPTTDWPEMDEIRKLIGKYDSDNSGTIRRDQFRLVFEDVLPLQPDDILRLLDGFSRDVDVNYANFLEWLAPACAPEKT
mmetsp:Transcript_85430/g.133517  ORF Transcript_85430/g.133517 Transcript_85430/m.133517 type:complete len:762 (-) Transcript_85430:333-2618(-)